MSSLLDRFCLRQSDKVPRSDSYGAENRKKLLQRYFGSPTESSSSHLVMTPIQILVFSSTISRGDAMQALLYKNEKQDSVWKRLTIYPMMPTEQLKY